MRIRRQSSARFQLAAEVLQLLLRKPSFEKCTGVNSRSSVSLEVHDIAIAVFRLRSQEMVERHLIQRGRRCIGRDMTANAAFYPVRADHHRHSIPAHQALDTSFHFLTSRKWGLLTDRNGVLVR